MPLLQFLAFYQVLEFYFPNFSQREVQDAIRNVLKDPTFSPDKSNDLLRLVSTVKVGAGGRGYGDELAQLRATVRGCTTADDLRSFFDEYPDRREFFQSKDAKSVANQKLPLSVPDADLRTEVADRIYEIRCRIVHTKGGDTEAVLLLPFSADSRKLAHDIEIVEFLARKVIVAASRPLRLPTWPATAPPTPPPPPPPTPASP